MAFGVTETVTIDSTSASAVTDYTTAAYTGPIQTIIYTQGTLSTGADIVVTTEDTGQTVWSESNVTASKTLCPRQATHSTAGVASLFATAGEPVEDYVWAINERLKIVTTQGSTGDSCSGSMRFVVGG
jgi:hypothetical protein